MFLIVWIQLTVHRLLLCTTHWSHYRAWFIVVSTYWAVLIWIKLFQLSDHVTIVLRWSPFTPCSIQSHNNQRSTMLSYWSISAIYCIEYHVTLRQPNRPSYPWLRWSSAWYPGSKAWVPGSKARYPGSSQGTIEPICTIVLMPLPYSVSFIIEVTL